MKTGLKVLSCFLAAAFAAVDRSLADAAAPASRPASVEFSAQELTRIFQHSPLPRPPPDPTNAVADNPAAARLGQFLFFETRLSREGWLSCATCHDPQLAFTDGKKLARGTGPHARHTLSLLNVAYNRWFFWDGRADTLWSQALGPIESPSELGSDRRHAVQLLHEDAELRKAYEQIFGTLPLSTSDSSATVPPTSSPADASVPPVPSPADTASRPADGAQIDRVFANLGKAIAAYERRLISADAPFDRFVLGLRTGDAEKRAALSQSAQRGLKLFIGRGNCRLCHSGPLFTDNEFHDIRLPSGGSTRLTDAGRFDGISLLQRNPFNAAGVCSDDPLCAIAERTRRLANNSQNWGQFKTPGLRNVARTAPYMHQGQFATLSDVIRYYSTFKGAAPSDQHQESILVPLGLSEGEIADLVAFLESLTGRDPDPQLMRKPETPLLPSK
jgi:cytochrome c peroxidase